VPARAARSARTAYCANTAYDPSNCSACGTICGPAGATTPGYANARAYCSSSACGATCTGTFADCNNNLADGCETDLSSSPTRCGSCLNACPAADNASPACASSACSTTCLTGFADCDLDRSNGCEADKSHDAANCGACGTACAGATPYCGGTGCAAAPSGVQQNLLLTAVTGDGWTLCSAFTESYSHVGTTLAAIQAACPAGTQVMVACAAPGASTLLAAAAGPRATVFTSGGPANGATFYLPGTAFGYAPTGAATTFSTFDVGGTTSDGFVAGVGSQRLSWPVQGGALAAGGRCGDRVGPSATSNYQRLVFTK
jgi:hypothetical protein